VYKAGGPGTVIGDGEIDGDREKGDEPCHRSSHREPRESAPGAAVGELKLHTGCRHSEFSVIRTLVITWCRHRTAASFALGASQS